MLTSCYVNLQLMELTGDPQVLSNHHAPEMLKSAFPYALGEDVRKKSLLMSILLTITKTLACGTEENFSGKQQLLEF